MDRMEEIAEHLEWMRANGWASTDEYQQFEREYKEALKESRTMLTEEGSDEY